MIKIIFSLFVLPIWLTAQIAPKKYSVLFIGNSYTYVNNLPQLVYQMALATNDTLVVDSYAPGGYTFNNHFNDANTLAKINSKAWDYVILQAQSQEPSFSPAQVNAQTFPYAKKLDSVIKHNNACTKTVFYETWGRKNGDASNCAFYPPICTYIGMQNRLKQSYKLFADYALGIMAPAGEAFRESISQNPNLELYQVDESHPSMEGSYLTAAVFYETLLQKSVVSNTFISSVNTATAGFLRQVAHNVVSDSLDVWNLGSNLPWADFTFTASTPSNYQFQSSSPNLSNYWNFGDGSSSLLAQPTHSYNSAGNYTVSHIVVDGCFKDSVAKPIAISGAVGLKEENLPSTCLVFPNPAQDFLWISGLKRDTSSECWMEIINTSGHVIKRLPYQNPVSLSDLSNGMYVLKIRSNNEQHYVHFAKSTP